MRLFVVVMTCVGWLFAGCGEMQQYFATDSHHTERYSSRTKREAVSYHGHTHPHSSILAPRGWQGGLPIDMHFSQEFTSEQMRVVESTMVTWEKAAGRSLFRIGRKINKVGDGYRDMYGSHGDGKNVIYMANFGRWRGNFDRFSGVVPLMLVYDQFRAPNEAMVQEADVYFNRRDLHDLKEISLHELGHVLGLGHVHKREDPDSIMLPSPNPGRAYKELSRGDILRLHRIYGCKQHACDVDRALANM